jgi:hypothetical protein
MKLPKPKGKLDVFPEIHYGRFPSVTIIGDPRGLRHLAALITKLADADQDKESAPEGSRLHIHIHPEQDLGINSCEVEICRADAKGTGEVPEYMKEEDEPEN